MIVSLHFGWSGDISGSVFVKINVVNKQLGSVIKQRKNGRFQLLYFYSLPIVYCRPNHKSHKSKKSFLRKSRKTISMLLHNSVEIS